MSEEGEGEVGFPAVHAILATLWQDPVPAMAATDSEPEGEREAGLTEEEGDEVVELDKSFTEEEEEEWVDDRVVAQLVEELGNRRKLGNEAFDEGSVMAAINIYQVNTSIQKEGITCTGGTSQTTSIQRMS